MYVLYSSQETRVLVKVHLDNKAIETDLFFVPPIILQLFVILILIPHLTGFQCCK